MNIFSRLLSAVVTGDTTYLNPGYGHEPVSRGKYYEPHQDANGTIHAKSYMDVQRAFTDGTTIGGDNSRHIVRTGKETWRIDVVPWNVDDLRKVSAEEAEHLPAEVFEVWLHQYLED